MTPVAAAPLTPDVIAAVRARLSDAAAPLKITEVVKGIPKPRKTPAASFQDDVRAFLDDEVRVGRGFRYHSGKAAAVRYWARDEKELLRTGTLDLCATPQAMTALKKELAKAVKGTDPAFLDGVVRELRAEGRLFDHPGKTKAAPPLFGTSPPPPPPPPLTLPKHAKAIDKLAKDCTKLLAAAGVSLDVLVETLKIRLGEKPPDPPAPAPAVDLERLILQAVASAPVLSIADLRHQMPPGHQGQAFNDSVRRLAEARRVVLFVDADPSRFTDAEKAALIPDGPVYFTTIAKGT